MFVAYRRRLCINGERGVEQVIGELGRIGGCSRCTVLRMECCVVCIEDEAVVEVVDCSRTAAACAKLALLYCGRVAGDNSRHAAIRSAFDAVGAAMAACARLASA